MEPKKSAQWLIYGHCADRREEAKNCMSSNAHGAPTAVTEEAARLDQELAAVNELLAEAIGQLYTPLNELAQAQIGRQRPLRRAAVVLAAGISNPDSAMLRQQRLYLASALEMLNVALAIHELLLAGQRTNDADNPNQRSITGSVILTGDYCFTQSAILAARTENVQVVELFSQTLKTISEGILRQIFSERNQWPVGEGPSEIESTSGSNTELQLCLAGVQGAALLLRTPAALMEANQQIVQTLAQHWQQARPNGKLTTLPLQQLPSVQQQRWQHLAAML
jgi:geranylgeranyl pyrophosphate synthase